MKAFSVGQVVEHFLYGVGTIASTDTERTTVDFELHGAKKFVTSIVKLEPSEKVLQARVTRRRAARKPKVAATA